MKHHLHQLSLKNKKKLSFVHIPLPKGDQRLFLSVIFPSGAAKDHKPGTAHFLEHMMFRGGGPYSSFEALNEAFEWLGGEWNGQTAQDFTEYTYQGHLSALPKVIELFGAFLKTPLFCDFEKERQVILREIEDDLNELGHSTDLDDHLVHLFRGNPSKEGSILGNVSSVKEITLEDLCAYRETHYQIDQMLISVVGNHPIKSLKKLLRQEWDSYPVFKPRKHILKQHIDFIGPKLCFVPHSDSQYTLAMGFHTPGEFQISQKNLATYEILTRILSDGFSSRLVNKVREDLGYSYDISGDLSCYRDFGIFDIRTSVSEDVLESTIKEILSILADLKANGPKESELKKSQTRYQVDLHFALSDGPTRAFQIGWAALHDRFLDEKAFLEALMSLSVYDIQAAAQEIFNVNAMGLVILGPKKTALTSFGSLVAHF